MTASALALQDVVRRYPGADQLAVDRVSLALRPGELLALVGASGSGKTTTLRIAAGYEQPDGGQVLLDGRDITRLPPERRGFGMVFQHYALFPHLSVEDNVAFGLEARGVGRAERRARARGALASVGLDGAGARPVQALSGGEQQRVALARALVIEPRVLLLDEPLSNLDPTLRVAMRDELRGLLRQTHVTALFVTHDQEDAFAVADRVALLERGRLLQVGTAEELYDAPASRAVAEFIGRAALVPARRDGSAHAGLTVGAVTLRVAVRPAANDASGAGGDDALAVLRPEALVLVPANADGGSGADGGLPADAWPARVVSRRFAGGSSVYQVALDGGPTVEVATPDRQVPEGARVGVQVRGEPVALVPAVAAVRDGRTPMRGMAAAGPTVSPAAGQAAGQAA